MEVEGRETTRLESEGTLDVENKIASGIVDTELFSVSTLQKRRRRKGECEQNGRGERIEGEMKEGSRTYRGGSRREGIRVNPGEGTSVQGRLKQGKKTHTTNMSKRRRNTQSKKRRDGGEQWKDRETETETDRRQPSLPILSNENQLSEEEGFATIAVMMMTRSKPARLIFSTAKKTRTEKTTKKNKKKQNHGGGETEGEKEE
jgi:hypothetical protein